MKEIIINKKKFSLSLEYILGLFEGDGSIYVQLKPNSSHKTGKQLILNWDMHQHVIDVDLLHAISTYLNCGKVEIGRKIGGKESWIYRYRISNQTDIINILLPILKSSDMVLNKRNHDKLLFIKICQLIQNKEHITLEGQEKIMNIIKLFSSKLDLNQKIVLSESNAELTSERVLGLTDAEGNFAFIIYTKNNKKRVQFRFSITQENTEIIFLNKLKSFFNCGQVYSGKKGAGSYYVTNKKDIINNILPFFKKNKLKTIKKETYLNFIEAMDICKNRILSQSDLEKLHNLSQKNKNKRLNISE